MLIGLIALVLISAVGGYAIARAGGGRMSDGSGWTPTREAVARGALPEADRAGRRSDVAEAGEPIPGGGDPLLEEDDDAATHGGLYPVRLISQALRLPLKRLRHLPDTPPELIAQLERVAWQARMLVSRPRPMQSLPTSPISLLQEAAEQVESLRLGKVNASWSLLTRQPVHVDPARTRGAFRELLVSATEAAGEAGRVGIRVAPGPREGYPVLVEIEIGARGAEPDNLAALVARHLLESQGARVEIDGRIVRVHLRSLSP